MRSGSLGSSRRKRKRIKRLKLLLVLLAIFAGALTAFEARFKTLRIAEMETNPASAFLVTQSMWAGIPKEAEDFWPRLWMSKKVYEKAIEKSHPVKARLNLKGWGKFALEVEYLNPLFKLYWENKHWYVSTDGKIWLASIADNDFIDLSDVLEKPVLAWGKEGTTPFDIVNAYGDVHNSSLPVTQIKAWYDNLDFLAWTNQVKTLQTGRREGFQVVRLVFKDDKGGDGVAILFPDSPEHWIESGLAVQKVFPDIMKISPEIFIDTTYKGKIIVSNRVK